VKKNSTTNLEMIELLARKKFGAPSSNNNSNLKENDPKKLKSELSTKSSKIIVPRQTRLTKDRANFSRAKFEEVQLNRL